MNGIIKRHHRWVINRRIAANKRAISASVTAAEPFGEREHLYMRHHALLEQRDA